MFRQFFGEDFQGFAPGQTGGVRFQRFGGGQVTGLQPVPLAVLHDESCGLQRLCSGPSAVGQGFTFNMGGGGMGGAVPLGAQFGGGGRAGAAGGGAAGGGLELLLPWPLPQIIVLVPAQLIGPLVILAVVWGGLFFLQNSATLRANFLWVGLGWVGLLMRWVGWLMRWVGLADALGWLRSHVLPAHPLACAGAPQAPALRGPLGGHRLRRIQPRRVPEVTRGAGLR
jgi:hypothetical protein